MCIPNTLEFWKKIEESAPFLRVTLPILDVYHFRRRLQSFRRSFFHSPFREIFWDFSSAWSTNNLDGIQSCRRVSILLRSCLVGFYRLFLVPKGYLFSQVYEIHRGNAPRLRAISWEVLSLYYCFSPSVTKRVSWDLFPGILQAFFGGRLSYLFCREGYSGIK